MQTPSVFIIILNYNGKTVLQKCLTSIFRSDYKNIEVVVVDNASSDGSLEEAMQKFSKVHFIKNSENIGFSRGNNLGIRFSLEKFADYILLLNNDTEIFSNTISLLVNYAEKNDQVGITSPLILGPNAKEIWFAGGRINWSKMSCSHILSLKAEKAYTIEYASGCAMLIKKEVFKKIGLFDERFFLYYEDTDFSLRAKKQNFNISLLPQAKIIHFEISNSTNPQKIYWLVISALIFFKLNAPAFFRVWYFIYIPIRKIKANFSRNTSSIQVRKAFADFKSIKD